MIVRWLSAYENCGRYSLQQMLDWELDSGNAERRIAVCAECYKGLPGVRPGPYGIAYNNKAIIRKLDGDVYSKRVNGTDLASTRAQYKGHYHNEVWVRKGCHVIGIVIKHNVIEPESWEIIQRVAKERKLKLLSHDGTDLPEPKLLPTGLLLAEEAEKIKAQYSKRIKESYDWFEDKMKVIDAKLNADTRLVDDMYNDDYNKGIGDYNVVCRLHDEIRQTYYAEKYAVGDERNKMIDAAVAEKVKALATCPREMELTFPIPLYKEV